MRSTLLVPFAVLAIVACDKKPETTASTSASVTPSASASASASVAPSASASNASHPGACKQLLAEKAKRCDEMAKGDPTIESACKEAIDHTTAAGDDARCWSAMNPPDASPTPDDEPE